MAKIKATVIFTAESDVEFEVPADLDRTNEEAVEAAIWDSIKRDGLPEVIENETIEFMFPQHVEVNIERPGAEDSPYEFDI